MAPTVTDLPLTAAGSSRGSTVPAEGRLEGTSIPELLCHLSRDGFSGSLMLERRGLRKVLYMRDGRLVFAASSDPEDRLGTFLLRRGEVRLAPLLEASGQVARGRRLGQILVESGVMDAGAVVRAVLDQTREVALSAFAWREGSFRLSKVALPTHESITLDLPMETLILAGVKRMRDWRWVRRAVGGPRAVYRRVDSSDAAPTGLGMTERAILDQLSHPCRVDRLCREVYAPSYDVYRSLWALSIIGAIEREDPRLAVTPVGVNNEGFLPPGGAITLLLELGASSFSGVARLFQDGMEGALFFKSGRVQFAASADTEKSLVTHLLRRGVISDHDHDDAVRRLLSGKRIGTILAERGALQPEDVERFVREQLMDVARHVALLTDGEYVLEPGIEISESIILDASVEDVVVEACMTLDLFDRIWDHLGGLSALLRLRRDYLDRLDRMTLRPAVWDLVSLLAQERTIEELLAARPEPDFELCRLIYALERVGVIERVGEQEILDRARQARAEVLATVADTPPVPQEVPVEPVAAAPETAIDVAPELFREEHRQSGPVKLPVTGFTAADETDLSDAFPPEPVAVITPATVDKTPPEGIVFHPSTITPPAMVTTTTSFELKSVDENAPVATSEPVAAELIDPRFDESTPAASSTTPSAVDLAQTMQIPRAMVAELLAASNAAPSVELPASAAATAAEPGTGFALVDEPLPAPSADPAAVIAEPAEPQLSTEVAVPPAEAGAAVLDTTLEMERPQFELDVPQAPPLDPVPPEILEEVDRFNRRHTLVFQEIRLEIGAGARNFVVTCLRRLGPFGAPFEGQVPDRNGIFDREPLGRSLQANWSGPPREALEGLIDMEVGLVSDLLAPARRSALMRALLETN